MSKGLKEISKFNFDEKPVVMSFENYLEEAKCNRELYISAAERMLKAIGEPEYVDTSKDSRLSKLFGNRVIRRYNTFADFYGMEDVIERIVSYFRHSAQNLEEARQILYLLGPVGSAKSSIAERLKALLETQPFYALAGSPINESPLGLISPLASDRLQIPETYLKHIPSPWAVKRLEEFGGDLSKFKVVKKYPSSIKQIAICKTEPGDENNQDISTLVGKLDIRQLENYSQADPDAYSYTGGLCLANRGMLDFVEMFKAPIKVLHPLLTATQENNYKGVEAIGAIPFDGVIVSHSNESEWNTFKNDKTNEAFLDRIYTVEVPYCTRVSEEISIYKKFINSSSLAEAPIAPGTLEMLARFSVLTRLTAPSTDATMTGAISKMMVYNGDNAKEKDPKAKSLQEYKDDASHDEGFSGVSTRAAYKILAEVFNFDAQEISADPVHLLYVLEKTIYSEHPNKDEADGLVEILKDYLAPEYAKQIGKDIQTAYLDSYSEYGQALFDRYLLYADNWCENQDYRDPDTGQMYSREALNSELEKIEKSAGIANPKDFRYEVTKWALRYRSDHKGNNPKWTSYEKLRRVIEATMFEKTEDLLPVISFSGHGTKEDKKKHKAFVERMVEMGYTERQVRRLVEWHTRISRS